MSDLAELTAVLEQLAGTATDGRGLVEAALVHGRRRRRRRAVVTVAVAVVVLGALVVAAVSTSPAFHHGAAPVGSPITVSPTPKLPFTPGQAVTARPWPTMSVAPYRQPGQLTLRLAANPRWRAVGSNVNTAQQSIDVDQTTSTVTQYLATVTAYDRGPDFDPSVLEAGEVVTVAGHEAYFVADLALQIPTIFTTDGWNRIREMAVGWRDSTGVWVLVGTGLDESPAQTVKRQELTDIAGLVQLGAAPTHLPSPVHLGYVPAGLQITSATFIPNTAVQTQASIGFGYAAGQTSDLDRAEPAIKVDVIQFDVAKGDATTLGPPTIVNGLSTWDLGDYYDVNTDTCAAQFILEDTSGRYSKIDLMQMISSATFVSCDDPSTWTDPLAP